MLDHDAPRWLDDDEQTAWLAFVGAMIRVPRELDRQLRRDAGMSHFEYQVLASLSAVDDRTLRMNELANRTEGSLSRLSQVVSKLEKRGWVRRRPDPTDGRYTLAELTDDGFETLAATAPGHVAKVRELVIDALTTTQLRHLRTASERILAGVEATESAEHETAGSDPT